MRNFLFVSIVMCGLCRSVVFAQSVTQYVNPFMGTTTLWTPEDLGYIRTVEKRPWGAETFPGAALPNAMVQLTPVTMYRSGSGYQYEDNMIYGFAHTSKGHWNLLHVPILPVTKEGGATPASYRSLFRHTEEEAHPGYYRVFLDRYKVNVELTSTFRCGYHRYTYREGDERQVLIDIARSNNQPRRWELKQSSARSFEGFQDGEGRIYFYAELSEDIDKTLSQGEGAGSKEQGAREYQMQEQSSRPLPHAPRPLIRITLKEPKANRPLELKIGFSFVSIENAKENLEAELTGKSFD
ncbi:MAG: glycoside hydrolase family 92 protein, partial [Bacteroidaceae bacterium]|nr:glycoside hydrolase family 92 protein [Bacteroidaceae bacterium]